MSNVNCSAPGDHPHISRSSSDPSHLTWFVPLAVPLSPDLGWSWGAYRCSTPIDWKLSTCQPFYPFVCWSYHWWRPRTAAVVDLPHKSRDLPLAERRTHQEVLCDLRGSWCYKISRLMLDPLVHNPPILDGKSPAIEGGGCLFTAGSTINHVEDRPRLVTPRGWSATRLLLQDVTIVSLEPNVSEISETWSFVPWRGFVDLGQLEFWS